MFGYNSMVVVFLSKYFKYFFSWRDWRQKSFLVCECWVPFCFLLFGFMFWGFFSYWMLSKNLNIFVS